MPVFSIIVPTYERPERLAVCLQSLARLDYPGDRFEVIVVDDGSRTPLDAVVAAFQDRCEISLITQRHAGPAAARNHGATHARGTILAFTDDDCTPAPDWLRTLNARFVATPDRVIGGRTLNALPENPYATASQLLATYLYAYYNADPNQARFLTSNNLAVPADRFQALGGFDPTFPLAAAEDREFCHRWVRHGYSMTYASDVVVYHHHALTWRRFWRQHVNYGRGAFHFHQLVVRRDQDRIRVEPPSFYWNLLRAPFSQTTGQPVVLMTALLVVSQMANAIGFVWERRKRGSRVL